ncbi:phosphatidate cytidylyltransferase [Spiroplasma endosymbiont of Amphibalanus improvisus]|uniref:phosphatidate cytidylyltransferase n=1 Tax=Spiroplasma endosymbiont of Amphibalanus improvisus TaxID=3066327 RepID=UPI00313C188D
MDKSQINELKKINSEKQKSEKKQLKKSIRKTQSDLFFSKLKLAKKRSRFFIFIILLIGLAGYLFVGAIASEWIDLPNIVIANYFFISFNTIILLIANVEILNLNKTKIPLGPKIISYFLIVLMYLTPSLMYYDKILYPPGSAINFSSDINVILFFVYIIYLVIYILLGLWGKDNKISIMFFTYALSNLLVFAFKAMNIIMLSTDHGLSNHGWIAVLWLMLIVISADTFAYLGGSKFGKNKLAPSISPNKTKEGALIGWIASSIIGIAFAFCFFGNFDYYFFPSETLGLRCFLYVILPIFLSVFSMLGDLLFSYVKRKYGVKDFSNLLGAHGGVLDRLDSVSLVFFIMYFICMILL